MKTSEVILHASIPAELSAKLAALDIDVPSRSEGRQTVQVERYSVAHLLATLPIELLSFPLKLTHGDRPDFVLEMGGCDVGIEHTEAVPENVARAQAMRECGLGPDAYFTPRALPGEPRKTSDELRREIKADRPGAGWYGDSPEREWAAAIAYYIKAKLPKVLAKGFLRYPVNWLIVYDGWPLPAVNYGKAASYLSALLMDMDVFSVFDAIFVHDDSRMCEFHEAPIIHTLVKPSATSAPVSAKGSG